MARLPGGLARRFRPLAGGAGGVAGLACPADTPTLQSVQRAARDEALRRAAWEAAHRQPAGNLATLDALVEVRWWWRRSCEGVTAGQLCERRACRCLARPSGPALTPPCAPRPRGCATQARHEVARLMGFPSYAAYQLDSFSLAGQPGAVAAFLQRFASAIAPKAAAEAADLRSLKAAALRGRRGGGGADPRPWDTHWLQAAARRGSDAAGLDTLPQYLELESVVEGLSTLLRRSMGVSLREVPLAPGEHAFVGGRRTDG